MIAAFTGTAATQEAMLYSTDTVTEATEAIDTEGVFIIYETKRVDDINFEYFQQDQVWDRPPKRIKPPAISARPVPFEKRISMIRRNHNL